MATRWDSQTTDPASAATEFDHLFKILLIGDSGVGKTCLMFRFSDAKFQESYISTIGVDFKMRTLDDFEGKKIRLQIWDTAGQERFRTITSSYYRGANGIIVIYDITEMDSFDNVRHWLSEIDRYANDGVVKMLVGNKCDLEGSRAVEQEMAQEVADKLEVPFHEASAKSDCNVNEMFEDMARLVLEKQSQQPVHSSAALKLDKEKQAAAAKSGCC